MDEQWRPLGESSQRGWIDPSASLPPEPPKPRRPIEVASTPARITAVLIDFVCFKVLTSLVVLVVAGIAIPFALGSGDDPRVANVATASVLAFNFLIAIGYFVVVPARHGGVTVGRRLAGIGPRDELGQPVAVSRVARHDAVLFVVPSLLFNPIGIVGLRDLAVLAGWCAMQVFRSASGATKLEQALGFKLFETRWNA